MWLIYTRGLKPLKLAINHSIISGNYYHLNLTVILWGGYHNDSHFTEEKKNKRN